jgi:K+-sensing histidine kinase KdpD
MSALNRKNKDNKREKDSSQAQEPIPREQPREKTVVIKARSIAKMPKAVSPPTSGAQHKGWSRLDHLYRISKLLLATGGDVDQTVAEVLAIISNVRPLLSAILIRETNGHAQMVFWHAEGVSAQNLRATQKNAMASYEYLSGSTCMLELDSSLVEVALETESSSKQKKNCIVIPLTVERGRTWGVLQLEGPTPFNESDLVFINAIGNQLAVALDRQKARKREVRAREQAEAAEQRMHFLADASRLLAASLNYLHTWESMAQLAVRHIADLCILDILEEDQSVRRIPVLSRNLPKEITEKQLEGALHNVVSEVMRTNRPVFYGESPESSLQSLDIPESTNRSVLDECPDFCESYMCVPLRVGERTLATLTMVSTRSDHLYGRTDQDLLQDLARRAVVAFENAQTYGTALQAIRSRDDLLNIVSHDLRAPLTIISGYVKMFLQNPRSGEHITCDAKHMEAIERSAEQMNRLIEDLLATGSIEAKQLMQRQLWAVVPLVNDALELLRPLAMRKRYPAAEPTFG